MSQIMDSEEGSFSSKNGKKHVEQVKNYFF